MKYTLSLAIVDFLPVLFTAFGLMYVARMIFHVNKPHGQAAFMGVFLTIAGGFFKAVWKLIMATSDSTIDIRWMEDGLFVWMAPGYTLLTWTVWQTVRGVNGKRMLNAWIFPLTFIAIMFVASFYLYNSKPDTPAWERLLLSVMVLATVITSLLLTVFGFLQKLPLVGWLFIVNLVGVFLLNGLARLDAQPIALQLIEESINAISWLCFAIAAQRAFHHAKISFGVD
jgi:hypothetical protein